MLPGQKDHKGIGRVFTSMTLERFWQLVDLWVDGDLSRDDCLELLQDVQLRLEKELNLGQVILDVIRLQPRNLLDLSHYLRMPVPKLHLCASILVEKGKLKINENLEYQVKDGA